MIGALEMEFKILFGCLKMDNFPQTEDEIRNLKSMTLEKDRQKLKFKCITLHRPDDQAKTKILLINGRDHHVEMTQMVSKIKEFTCCVFVKYTE